MPKQQAIGLSHAERRERRQRIAAAVTAGKAMTEVATEFGVSFSTVVNACDENNVPRDVRRSGVVGPEGLAIREHPQTRVTREQWAAVDWSLRDQDLATLLDVSRERVRQIRERLAKGRAKYHRNRAGGIFLRRWLESIADSVPSLTVAQLIEQCPRKTRYSALKKIIADMGMTAAPVKRLDQLVTKDTLASFVTVTGEKGCWEWNFGSLRAGYGTVGNSRNEWGGYAHRFVFELFNGPLPEGKWCLHTCDNPKCVNPSHLYAGTAADNARDRMVRGRDNTRLLSMDQAVAIRERFAKGDTIKALAEEFGVSMNCIYGIVRGRSYRDYSATA